MRWIPLFSLRIRVSCYPFFLTLWVIGLNATVAVCAELFLAPTGPPSGFEALAEPWETMVDVFYGSHYLVSTYATVSPGAISFHDPSAVVQKISSLRDSVAVMAALSGRLADNANRLCLKTGAAQPGGRDCGWITPEVAGVIFDEQYFRVTVFVAPEYIETTGIPDRQYLPPPTSKELGFIQTLNATASGASRGTSNRVLYGLSMLSRGTDELETNWDVANSRGGRISSFFAGRDYEGMELRAGYMHTSGFGFSFSPDQPILGIHTSFSENTRLDMSSWRTTPVDVFLPTRGRVQVYKEGLLLQAWLLDAGSHQLDTRTFPTGAYTLTIQIYSEDGQLINEEARFFVSQPGLPPAGATLWFAEAGRLLHRNQQGFWPSIADSRLVRGGLSRRLGNRWGSTIAAAATGEAGLAELGAQWFGEFFEFSPALMLSSQRDRGGRADGRLYGKFWHLSFGYRKLLLHENKSPDLVLLGRNTESFYVSGFGKLWDGQLQYRYVRTSSVTRSGELIKGSGQHALSYSRTLLKDQLFELDGSLEVSRIAGNARILCGLSFRFRQDALHQSLFVRYGRSHRAGERQEREGSVRYSIADAWGFSGGNRLNAGGWLEAMDNYQGGGGDFNYVNREAAFNGSVGYSSNRIGNEVVRTTAWTAGSSTTFSISRGGFAFGGQHVGRCMLVVQMSGVDKSAVFNVFVNGQVVAYTRGQLATVVPLSPFETYVVRVTGAGAKLYDYRDTERQVTLYPGNVALLSFNARLVRLVFGQLRDSDGQPLENIVVRAGESRTVTDSMGIYQLEIPGDASELVVGDGKEVIDVGAGPTDGDQKETWLPVINLGITTLKSVHTPAKKQEEPESESFFREGDLNSSPDAL